MATYRKRLSLLSLFIFSLAFIWRLSLAPTANAVPIGDHGNELRMNQIQVVGTHNSYHREPLLAERWAHDLLLVAPLNYYYSHASLTDQLEHQGVRGLELDVYADTKGGLYATPLLRSLSGLKQLGEEVPEMQLPGTKVLHVADADIGTACHTLVGCLTEIKEWSDAHRDHVPVSIIIEFKKTELHLSLMGGAKSEPWTPEYLDKLDDEIRSVFPNERMILPDDIRHEGMTLEESLLRYGWPTFEASRGKVFFLMDNNPDPGDIRKAYRVNGHENLEGRIIFTNSLPGEPDAAYIKRNDPLGENNQGHIRDLVKKGYYVRTRADLPVETVVGNNYTMRDWAFKSGAQVVSTDWPGVGMASRYGTDYVVRLRGGATWKCNPVNAPDSCGGGVEGGRFMYEQQEISHEL